MDSLELKVPPPIVLLLFVAYLSRFQILPEEKILERHFGQAWRDYAGRVRRWL